MKICITSLDDEEKRMEEVGKIINFFVTKSDRKQSHFESLSEVTIDDLLSNAFDQYNATNQTKEKVFYIGFSEVKHEGKPFYIIGFKDNAGGFPHDTCTKPHIVGKPRDNKNSFQKRAENDKYPRLLGFSEETSMGITSTKVMDASEGGGGAGLDNMVKLIQTAYGQVQIRNEGDDKGNGATIYWQIPVPKEGCLVIPRFAMKPDSKSFKGFCDLEHDFFSIFPVEYTKEQSSELISKTKKGSVHGDSKYIDSHHHVSRDGSLNNVKVKQNGNALVWVGVAAVVATAAVLASSFL